MNVTTNDAILLAHATFGVLGTLSAVWVFVETLNAREQNAWRIRRAALAVAIYMVLAWIFGGYWYLHYYPVERAMILKGSWPFAHTLFMETKEHLFLMTLILSLYLPIAAWDELHVRAAARKMVLLRCDADRPDGPIYQKALERSSITELKSRSYVPARKGLKSECRCFEVESRQRRFRHGCCHHRTFQYGASMGEGCVQAFE